MPADSGIALRPATAADAERLRAWRNDPEVVSQSLSGQPVGEREHAAWLERTLADARARLYVVEDDGRPIGQVRLTGEAGGAVEVHVALAPEARARGIGRRVLRLAAARAAAELDAPTVVARVLPSNERSLRAFLAAGFRERERSEEAIVLERGSIS